MSKHRRPQSWWQEWRYALWYGSYVAACLLMCALVWLIVSLVF